MKFCNCRRILDIYSQGLLIIQLHEKLLEVNCITKADVHIYNIGTPYERLIL